MLAVIGIIVARVDSTRLRGKVLKQVCDIPLIGYVIARAKRIGGLDGLALATTGRLIDDPLVAYALAQGITVYRGSLNDVALRVLNCAKTLGGDYFVRLNGDAPFIDPELVTQGITYCREGQPDLITNLIGRTFPYGISVEVVERRAFERAYACMTTFEEHEHVTQYLYRYPKEFEIRTMTSSIPTLSRARMVVDTISDFRKFESVVVQLGEAVLVADYRQVAQLYLQ